MGIDKEGIWLPFNNCEDWLTRDTFGFKQRCVLEDGDSFSKVYLYYVIQDILSEETMEKLFYISKGSKTISLLRIKELLKEKGYPDVPLKEINLAIHFMISNWMDGTVVRFDNLGEPPQFKRLDPYIFGHGSSAQRNHYSVEDDTSSENKVIALISDTHIGNNDIFSSKLLHNIYRYFTDNGADFCVHLGDLYQRLMVKSLDKSGKLLSLDDATKLLSIFTTEYPDELMTYIVMGNHDIEMNNIMTSRGFDFRWLSGLNPNVYMLSPGEYRNSLMWHPLINGKKFNFYHGATDGFRKYKIDSIEDFIHQLEEWYNPHKMLPVDVYVSGHLHDGFAWGDDKDGNNKLFLGVPSTSLENVGSAVGYLLYTYPRENCMRIVVLGCDNNLNIKPIDEFVWNFSGENKRVNKVYLRKR